MNNTLRHADVVMLGTFAAWKLGTIQARALPLASELQKLGVRITIVTTPWDMPSEAGMVDVVDGVTIVNTNDTSPRAPLMAVMQQVQWVRRLSPALVHVFKPKGFGGLAGRALMRSVPVIVDSDDWEGDGGWNQVAGYPRLQQRMFQFQEHDLLRNALHVTAASTLLEERALRLRGTDRNLKVHRIANGLTTRRLTDLAAGRTFPPSRHDPPVVTLYSRFAEFEPGWLEAFTTALNLNLNRPLTLLIVGEPIAQSNRVKETELVKVEMMGYVSSDSIPAILGRSTLAVYPYRDSLITRSKQSVKLLELMAAGCPVVASDVGDVAATLGAGGDIVSGAEPETFARRVTQLLDAPDRLDSMSAEGQSRARLRFDFDSLARQLLDVYSDAGLR